MRKVEIEDSKEKMIRCPKCDGGKNPLVNFPAFPNKKMLEVGEDKLMEMFACLLCKGKGEVPDQTASWVENGKILKDLRIEKRLTLRKAAKALNILASKLSEMERGSKEPDMSIQY